MRLPHDLQRLITLILIVLIPAAALEAMPLEQLGRIGYEPSGTTADWLSFITDLLANPQVASLLIKHHEERTALVQYVSEHYQQSGWWISNRTLVIQVLTDEETFLITTRNPWLFSILKNAYDSNPDLFDSLMKDREKTNEILRWITAHPKYAEDFMVDPELLRILQGRDLTEDVLDVQVAFTQPPQFSEVVYGASVNVVAKSPYGIRQVEISWLRWNENRSIALRTFDPPVTPASFSMYWETLEIDDGGYTLAARAVDTRNETYESYTPVFVSHNIYSMRLSSETEKTFASSENGRISGVTTGFQIPFYNPYGPKVQFEKRPFIGHARYSGTELDGTVELDGELLVNLLDGSGSLDGAFTYVSYGNVSERIAGRFAAKVQQFTRVKGVMTGTGIGPLTGQMLSGNFSIDFKPNFRGEVNMFEASFTGSRYSETIALSEHGRLVLGVKTGAFFGAVGYTEGQTVTVELTVPANRYQIWLSVNDSSSPDEYATINDTYTLSPQTPTDSGASDLDARTDISYPKPLVQISGTIHELAIENRGLTEIVLTLIPTVIGA